MRSHVLIKNPLSAETKKMPKSSLKKVSNATRFVYQKVAGLLWNMAYQEKNIHWFKPQ